MRLTRPACLVLGASLLMLTACGDDGGTPAVEESPVLDEPETVLTVEPLDGIDGAERVVVEGVGIDLPEGVTGETTELSEDVTQLVARGADQDRAYLVLTVTQQEDVSDSDVFLTMRATAAQLSPEDVPVREEIGVAWDGYPQGWGLRGELELGDGRPREFLYTVTRDERGTRVVGISVEAPEGGLEDSVGYEMLRTVRVEG